MRITSEFIRDFSKVPFSENPVFLNEYDGQKVNFECLTSFETAWNDFGFFLRFKAGDPFSKDSELIESTSYYRTKELWKISQVCEAFIAWGSPDKYREFQFAPDGRFLDISIDASTTPRHADFDWRSRLQYRAYTLSRVHICEAVIPWTAFPALPPSSGDIWHGNFFRIFSYGDRSIYMSWSPTFKVDFHQPICFGEILFR